MIVQRSLPALPLLLFTTLSMARTTGGHDAQLLGPKLLTDICWDCLFPIRLGTWPLINEGRIPNGAYDRATPFCKCVNDNNQIANQTTDTTYVSFDLPPRANDECQWLEFRVTAVEVQHPECPDIEQTHYSTYLYTKPDVPPVTAEFNNKTVLVSWPSDGDNAFLVVVTDLESGNQTTYNGTSPFSYTPSLCGRFNLNVSVSPAQCANDPAFTHSDSISFTINCPTTATFL